MFSKQICLWDLAQSIGILFIIQIVGAIRFFVAMVLPPMNFSDDYSVGVHVSIIELPISEI